MTLSAEAPAAPARAPESAPPWRPLLGAAMLLGTVVLVTFLLPPRLVLAGMGAAGRPAYVLGFALFLWWVLTWLHPALRPPRGRQPMRRALLLWGLVLVAAWGAGYGRGLLPAESGGADRALIVFAAYLGIALVAADGLTRRCSLDAVLRWTTWGAAVMAAVGAVQFFAKIDPTQYIRIPGLQLNAALITIGTRGAEQFARVAGTAGHYIEFGVVASMVLPIAIHYALFAPTRRSRENRWFIALLIAAVIPLSVSRAGAVALLVGMTVMFLGWDGRRRVLGMILGFFGMAAFMIVVPGLLGTIKSLFLNASKDPSITGRTEDYLSTWRYIHQAPVLGRGTGTFTPEIYRLLDNQWLLTLVETGWVGIVAFVFLLATGFALLYLVRRRATATGDAETKNLALALTAALVVATVTPFFFDALYFSTFSVLLFVVLGSAGALWRLQGAELAAVGLAPPPLRVRLAELGGEAMSFRRRPAHRRRA